MEEKSLSFTEGQFMRLGVKEAYNTQLIEQMKNSVPFIEHHFSKEYEGGNTETIFHLKKSASSDNYFINKFDMSLQKIGSDKTLKQTFYINNKKPNNEDETQKEKVDNYTYKMAYNFLSGRPVHLNNNQAWEQIKPDVKLENGNYATQRYDKNYGFNLDNVVDNYSLANQKYKPSLVESLNRGNLQKEKFLDKEGNIQEYFVSPSIKTGSLILYDQDKKVVPLETQIEKQIISKELGERLNELYSQKQRIDKYDTTNTVNQASKGKKNQK
ncbi:hypothetical protein ACDQ55_15275 [Chitinophaga sp. 30R24]|uniref:hypothetical protein n=1 Tax=Chitinophaga sp. 30R24 TaxID=3248838 RepID=UPI003B8F7354